MQSPKAKTRTGSPQLVVAVCLAALSMEVASAAFGQTSSLLTGGPPVQVVPYVAEPGVPMVSVTPGTANPFAGADGSGGSGSGGTSGPGGGNVGDSDALSTMLDQSWGAAAVSNASMLGVNPSALAATCVVESGCQNVGGSGTVAGAFQMTASTYTAMINAALAQNPSLQVRSCRAWRANGPSDGVNRSFRIPVAGRSIPAEQWRLEPDRHGRQRIL